MIEVISGILGGLIIGAVITFYMLMSVLTRASKTLFIEFEKRR